jgi:7-cyano-7-deazaguanine synthase in queuosine biosynthesis
MIVLLLSGGVNSAVALADALNRDLAVHAVHCTDDPQHPETLAARALARLYKVPGTVFRFPKVKGLHPAAFRTGRMLAYAAAVAESVGAVQIGTGHHALSAQFPDERPEFRDSFSFALAQGTYGSIKLVAPWEAFTKEQVLHVGHRLEVPLALTRSCPAAGPVHCGTCLPCTRRQEAFLRAEVADPTQYTEKAVWTP